MKVFFVLLLLLLLFPSCVQKHENKLEFPEPERVEISGKYRIEYHTTSKISNGTNEDLAVVLHHTASKNILEALTSLCYSDLQSSCHVLIDKDGTRYVLASPECVTWHAGYSTLNGRDNVNAFSIGIEFQGNTLVESLTQDQINSAIDYLIPIMKRYNIPVENVVTHEQIRTSWIVSHPQETLEKDVKSKVDITLKEYERFISHLKINTDTKSETNLLK